MNILFICTANKQRSPAAEELVNKTKYNKENKDKQKYEKHYAKSAGIHPLAPIQVTQESIKWADKIFVMENIHKEFLLKNFKVKENKIIVLNIPDMYEKNSPELVNILKEKLDAYLN